MTDISKIREAHRIVKNAGSVMTREQIDFLHSMLPPLPKQKTLEELREEVYAAWLGAGGNTWDYDGHELETWLDELHTQLKGLVDAEPTAVPALPEGMRIAEHEKRGRCVVSPKTAPDGAYLIFFCSPAAVSGGFWGWAHRDSLTFIDSEPAHPEFLETEADYEEAPVGTIVTMDGVSSAWVKEQYGWPGIRDSIASSAHTMAGLRRRVLRWRFGNA